MSFVRSAFAGSLLCTLLFSSSAVSQDNNTAAIDSLYAELDSIFANEKIPDLFRLADSIFAMDSAKVSALNLRTGYVSKVVSSGRTFGFNQSGIVPGLAYYHHTGLYAAATGYWSSEFEPQYYLTDLSLGYSHVFLKRINLIATHDFLFYNDTLATHSFDKSAQLAVYYQRKFMDAGVDYTFLYGNEDAHRLTANLTGKVTIRAKKSKSRIRVLPTFSIQYGTGNVLYVRQPRTAVSELHQIIKQNDFPSLTLRQHIKLTYLLEQERETAARVFLRYHEYSGEQINTLIEEYYEGQYREENAFGLMNYSFSVPVMMTMDRWTITLGYTYNVPVALPGEYYDYEPNGYFSSSVSYTIQWIKM
jgi:hypothetical protein